MLHYLQSIKGLWQRSRQTYLSVRMFRLMLLSVLVGVIAGLGASLFFLGVEGCRFLLLHKLAGISLPGLESDTLFTGEAGSLKAWMIPACTTVVGLLTGWLVYCFIPDAQQDGVTDGTDTMTRSFHQEEGKIRPLVPVIKGATAILTIGSGGSAGREGPITQIGAGIGSFLGTKCNLSPKERRILLLAGAGGGLGAIFKAPLGGALTGVEIIYTEDFESEALLPAIISSVIAYTVFTLIYSPHPMMDIPRFDFDSRELVFYALLAFVCSVVAWFYVKTFYAIKYRFFQPIKQRFGLILTTGLGGLIMGLLGMCYPQVLSGGYGWIKLAILGKLSISMLGGLLVGKTLATSITLGSEMSGGMFAPALFVGGMSGGLVGQVSHMYFPSIVTEPGSYVLVGMAAFFAGAGSAPVGPFIIVCELTQDYALLAPLMLASAICIFMTRRFSLYENQLGNKFQSPAHSEELFIMDVLQHHKVQELTNKLEQVKVVQEDMAFRDFKALFRETRQNTFPVVDDQSKLVGIFNTTDVRHELFNPDIDSLVVVKDVAIGDMITIRLSDYLSTALSKLTTNNLDALPVVADDDPYELLGILRRKEVIDFYNEQIEQQR